MFTIYHINLREWIIFFKHLIFCITIKYVFRLASLPWNEKTFMGYIASLTYNVVVLMVYVFWNSITMSFFIGTALYFQAFYEHFVLFISEIDKLSAPKLLQEEIYVKNILSKAIQFHIFAKQ